MNDNDLMQLACELADENVECGGGPFGCIITDKKNNILSKGQNRVTDNMDPTAHAEIVAIRKACSLFKTYDLSGLKLYSSCEPCPMCLSAIYWARINDVYYSNTRNDAKNIGFDDEYIYDELTKNVSERTIHMVQIKTENQSNAFNSWENKMDKSLY